MASGKSFKDKDGNRVRLFPVAFDPAPLHAELRRPAGAWANAPRGSDGDFGDNGCVICQVVADGKLPQSARCKD